MHRQRAIQGIRPERLAFPPRILRQIQQHMSRTTGRQAPLLLGATVHALQAVECEATPRGVVHAVWRVFAALHDDIRQVVATGGGGGGSPSCAAKPTTFLNADVLLPFLVLALSRVDDLRLLPRRLALVQTFQGACLGDAGERAYYVTCLQAAFAFVVDARHRPDGGGEHADEGDETRHQATEVEEQDGQPCAECVRMERSVYVALCGDEAPGGTAEGTSAAWPTTTDADAVRALSSWIAMHATLDGTLDALEHEVWMVEA